MAQTATASTALGSGNPALSETFVETHLTAPAPRSMTVAGVSAKTLVLLAVLVAGGAWGWAAAVEPTAADLGSGYANTTVTLDFGAVETGAQSGASKDLEWYLAFGLMVTLVWLYISILKLLALLSRNR